MPYEYGTAVVKFLEGSFNEAAEMFLEGAREGAITKRSLMKCAKASTTSSLVTEMSRISLP